MVVAAGIGSRLGLDVPKAFVQLRGRTLLEHALTRLRDSATVEEIVVVVPPSHVGAVEPAGDISAVPGGPTRRESVHRGLAALSDEVDVVLVHDAARCLAPADLFADVVAAVRAGHAAVVPGVPVADTIRTVDGRTVERSRLRAVQTPQGFSRPVLEAAHARAAAGADAGALEATDDAGLVERAGAAVHVLPGSPEAFKVTTPLDLLLAGAVLDRGAGR